MPGYGLAPADGGDGLLPWSWAARRLKRARHYWVATSRPDGSPHLAAVWGLWRDDAFHFSTGGRSRKARNLAANPRCVVTPEQATESVVVEGVAEPVTDPAALAALQAAYRAKYGEGFPDPAQNPVFTVRPGVVFGIIGREPEFTTMATRWVFPARDPGGETQMADVLERLRDAQNAHDLDAFVACFDPRYRSEQPVHPDRAFVGAEQVRTNWAEVFAGVPDFRAELLRSAHQGDTGWGEWHWHGTRGDGTRLDMRGVTIFGVRDGRILWGRLYLEDVAGGQTIDQAVHHMTHGPE